MRGNLLRDQGPKRRSSRDQGPNRGLKGPLEGSQSETVRGKLHSNFTCFLRQDLGSRQVFRAVPVPGHPPGEVRDAAAQMEDRPADYQAATPEIVAGPWPEPAAPRFLQGLPGNTESGGQPHAVSSAGGNPMAPPLQVESSAAAHVPQQVGTQQEAVHSAAQQAQRLEQETKDKATNTKLWIADAVTVNKNLAFHSQGRGLRTGVDGFAKGKSAKIVFAAFCEVLKELRQRHVFTRKKMQELYDNLAEGNSDAPCRKTFFPTTSERIGLLLCKDSLPKTGKGRGWEAAIKAASTSYFQTST